MTPSLQRRAEDAFKAVLAAAPAVRTALLDSLCGDDADLRSEVLSLLHANDSATGVLDRQLAGPAPTADRLAPGQRLGQYTIRGALGAGGMGVVYRADQSRPNRTVALKVIRHDLATPALLRRFEFEAEVLGRLQHPGIAQIFEAGAAESDHGPRPFFAMELVDGLPLTRFASDRALGTRARLDLFTRVCDAVEHAHQRGVIHRDLKPANILVDAQGQPKVLDFGVARAAAPDARLTIVPTGQHQIIGTLAYMSPEQVSGSADAVDTRSDVYSLGVILFELLTGRLPLDPANLSLPEAVRAIAERAPATLSTHHPAFRGDLDTILAVALVKDPARRYQSAAALASDVRRHLAHEPILARPASVSYLLRSYAKRHRGVVIAAAAAAVFLLAGLASSLVAWRQAIRDRNAQASARMTAQTAAARAQSISTFLKSTLLSINPTVARGRDTQLLREVMATTVRRLDSELADQPDVRAEMLATVGEVYLRLGQHPSALQCFDAALAIIPRDSLAAASILTKRGGALATMGRMDEAAASFDESRRAHTALGATHSIPGLEAGIGHASLLRQTNKLNEAKSLITDVVAASRALGPDGVPTLLLALNTQGAIESDLGDYGHAETALNEAVDLGVARFGDDDVRVAEIRSMLAAILQETDRAEAAVALLRKTIPVYDRVLSPDHPRSANDRVVLASSLLSLQPPDESIALIQAAVAADRRSNLAGSPMIANHLMLLAEAYRHKGDHRAALDALAEALPIAEGAVGPEHVLTIDIYESLARNTAALGQFERAIDLATEAINRLSASPRHDPEWLKKLTDFRAGLIEQRCQASDAAKP